MKSPAFLPVVAIIAALAPLAACVSQDPKPLSANEGIQLQPCAEITGTRIRSSRRGNCAPIGYSYKNFSAEDLEATSGLSLGDALRELDPAFR